MVEPSKNGDPEGIVKSTKTIRGNLIKRGMFIEVMGICRRRCPIDFEKLLSWIEVETGAKRDTAKNMLMALADIDYIKVDEENKIIELVKNE